MRKVIEPKKRSGKNAKLSRLEENLAGVEHNLYKLMLLVPNVVSPDTPVGGVKKIRREDIDKIADDQREGSRVSNKSAGHNEGQDHSRIKQQRSDHGKHDRRKNKSYGSLFRCFLLSSTFKQSKEGNSKGLFFKT